METLEDPAPGGKGLEETLACTAVTTEVWAGITRGHIPWMDLMHPTGEEKMQAGLWSKQMKTRMPGLKNPGSIARSRGENNRMKKVLS